MAKKETCVRIGNSGKPHPAQVKLYGGAIVVSRADDDSHYRDSKNFPIRISLTKEDGLKLVAAICERIARYDLL